MGALVTLLPQLFTALTPVILAAYAKRKAELGRDPTEDEVVAELHATVQQGLSKIDAWDAQHPAGPTA